MSEKQTEFFPITSVCREDIENILKIKDVDLEDFEMKYIARKMADDYIEQLYWSSLKYIAQDYIDNVRGK